MLPMLFWFSLVILDVILGVECSVSDSNSVWNLRHVLPELKLANSNNSVRDVHFNVGDNAFLPCKFHRYSRHHENGVSWIRRRDWQIISAGIYINTKDDRFAVLHKDASDEWILQVKYVQKSDVGTYECQVHTGSGFLSHFVKLHVSRPRAVILGPEELHVRTGDEFSITCVIEKILSTPMYLMWLHRGQPMNYAPDRPRLSIGVHPQGIHTTSTLNVVDTNYTDSGNYTCTSPNADSASIIVYVTEGDNVAAVQRREVQNEANSLTQLSTFFISIFFLHLCPRHVNHLQI